MGSPPGGGPHHSPVGHSQPPPHPSQPQPPHSQHSQVRSPQQQPSAGLIQPPHSTHSQNLVPQGGPQQGLQSLPQVSLGINPQGLTMQTTVSQGPTSTTVGPQHPISNGIMVHQGIPKVSCS